MSTDPHREPWRCPHCDRDTRESWHDVHCDGDPRLFINLPRHTDVERKRRSRPDFDRA